MTIRHARIFLVSLFSVSFVFGSTAYGQLFVHFPLDEVDSPLVDISSGLTAEALDEGHLYSLPGPPGFGTSVGLSENGSWQFDLQESLVFNIIPNDFTVAAWIYLDSAIVATKSGANSTLNRIIGDDIAWDADGWGIGVFNDGRIRFTKNGITDSDTTDEWVAQDEWSHVAATVSSADGITIYYNGQAVQNWPDRTPDVNPWPGNNGMEDNWGIGRTYGSGEAQWVAGRFDDIRVYNGVLSEEEIAALMVPDASLDCDFNGDNVCDTVDIDLMFAAGDLVTGSSVPPADAVFDLNVDGIVNTLDSDQWLSSAATENGFAAPYLKGDANLDGTVDATDLNALALSWQGSGKVWSDGDFTGEGTSNVADLNLLGVNWQRSIPAAAASKSVPEPASIILLSVAAILGLSMRRKL